LNFKARQAVASSATATDRLTDIKITKENIMSPEIREKLKSLKNDWPNGQSAFEGLEPPTQGAKLIGVVRMPMRGPQASLDIGFWDPMRKQLELL